MKQKCIKCEICDLKCADKVQLIKHTTDHDRIGSKYQCEYCKINFTMKRHLKEHCYEVHQYQKSFKCKNCPKVYFKRIHYERHIIIAHCTIEKFNHLVRTQFREMDHRRPQNKFNTATDSRNNANIIDLTAHDVIKTNKQEEAINRLSSQRIDEHIKIVEHSLATKYADVIDLTVDSYLTKSGERKKRSAFHNIEDLLREDPTICKVHKLKLCVCRLINKSE